MFNDMFTQPYPSYHTPQTKVKTRISITLLAGCNNRTFKTTKISIIRDVKSRYFQVIQIRL